MPRIRSVHPGLFIDDAFMELSMAARMLLIGIWVQADDHGIFEWRPRSLRAAIFPGDGGDLDIAALLTELEGQNCIKRFEDGGKAFGAARNFCAFQRPRDPSYRYPLPQSLHGYVAIDRIKATSSPQANSGTTAVPPQSPCEPTEIAPHRSRSRSGKREKQNPAEKESVVVVAPQAEEAAPKVLADASETTTTTVLKPAPQATGGLGRLLGKPLAADWVPDETTQKRVLDDFGMTFEAINAELPAFHALNVQNGTLSRDWNATFYLFAKRWKERQAKTAAPRIELSRGVSERVKPPEQFTEAEWDGIVAFYAQTGRWARNAGPDPMSPACICPKDILARHEVNLETGERRIPPRKVSA